MRAQSQSVHDAMVRTLALRLKDQYRDLRADHPEFFPPQKIYWSRTGEGHIPDLTGGRIVIEVETEDTLGSDHTRSQCMLFGTFAAEHGRQFIVAVPRGCRLRMQNWLEIWHVRAEVIEL